ncbi:MAG: glycosyltransferase family 4 protein [Limibacillus sp.]|jgi:glycosyltransferase involved in cell wall biosynthesis
MAKRLLYLVSDAGYFLAHRAALAKAASKAGWRVEVATAPDPRQADIEALGFAAHSIPFKRHGMSPLAAAESLFAILKLYRELKPDLVHHVTLKAVLLGGLAAKLAGVPARVHSITGVGHVFTEGGPKWRLLQGLIRRWVAFITPAKARIVTEHAADLETIAPGAAVRARGRVILGSGVDTDLFAEAEEPPFPPVRFLLASRLIEKKGIADYARAGAELKQQGVAVEFLLAGAPDEGAPGAIPESRLRSWEEEGCLVWLGARADMPALMASCHAVVLPSRYGEGVPRCLIEGASVGRALIASDLPGCREIVRDGVNGLIVAEGDWRALAEAAKRLIEDPETRAAMGREGRKLAVSHFSDARVTRETLAVYEEIAG